MPWSNVCNTHAIPWSQVFTAVLFISQLLKSFFSLFCVFSKPQWGFRPWLNMHSFLSLINSNVSLSAPTHFIKKSCYWTKLKATQTSRYKHKYLENICQHNYLILEQQQVSPELKISPVMSLIPGLLFQTWNVSHGTGLYPFSHKSNG